MILKVNLNHVLWNFYRKPGGCITYNVNESEIVRFWEYVGFRSKTRRDVCASFCYNILWCYIQCPCLIYVVVKTKQKKIPKQSVLLIKLQILKITKLWGMLLFWFLLNGAIPCIFSCIYWILWLLGSRSSVATHISNGIYLNKKNKYLLPLYFGFHNTNSQFIFPFTPLT